jgi:hypothetical protein
MSYFLPQIPTKPTLWIIPSSQKICTTEFPNGYTGEQFKAKKERSFKADLFSVSELEVLSKVASVFKATTTTDIIELSHLEEAWKKNEKDKSVISYEYAFELNQI